MSLFLTTLREGSEIHSVEATSEGFTILRKPGFETGFNALARRVMDDSGPYVALPIPDGHGGYEAVQIITSDGQGDSAR